MKFEIPTLDIEKFEMADVVTTSSIEEEGNNCGSNACPFD